MERKIALPTWCSRLCDHSMMNVCVEGCAVDRNCSWFKLKPGITIEDLPEYPINETHKMTRYEKFASVAVYIEVMRRHLKGESDGREILYRTRSFKNSKAVKQQGVSFGPTRDNPTRQDRTERSDKRVRFEGLA